MDYRQLALRFVLSEDDNEHSQLASTAAKKLAASPLEIKDWILSVSQWLSLTDSDDSDSDMIVYGKAVDFLSSTLDKLDKSKPVFKEPQVGLLITFFCNILQNQHGGILPSCRALASLAEMPAFPASRAIDVLDGVENMGDYLRQQLPGTRLVVYRLLRSLMTSEEIKQELGSRPGASGVFMKGILDVCKNERDPMCLLAWFGVLGDYLHRFNPSTDMVERTFSLFSSYFPITVRASQTPAGITGDDLKKALRDCFSADDVVAPFAIPYLTEKLERGDGLTLSVRTDILQTLDACLTQYGHVATTIVPYSDKLWLTLKHEVRAGDEPDAIKLALQAIRTLIRRLEGGDLTRLLSTVASDCHEDLTAPSHTEAAGKLLVVVMSATSSAFGELAPKTIDFLRRQLAGSSNAQHLRDLVVVLNSILELRPSVMGSADGEDIRPDSLGSLFEGTYESLTKRHLREDADEDDIAVACKALRGLGLLTTQPLAGSSEGEYKRLLEDETCRQICARLSNAIIEAPGGPKFDTVTQEAAAALAHISPVYAGGIRAFTALAFGSEPSTLTPVALYRLTPILVYVGTQELPAVGDQLERFVYVAITLLRLLQSANDETSAELVLGILNAMMQFRSRFISSASQVTISTPTLEDHIARTYPELSQLGSDFEAKAAADDQLGAQISLEESFFTICLFITKYLIRQATILRRDEATNQLRLSLGGSHDATKTELESLRMVTIGRIATFTLRHIDPTCQINLGLPSQIFCLFHPISLSVEGGDSAPNSQNQISLRSAWELVAPSPDVANDGIVQISLGIAEGIAPSGVQSLRDEHPVHVHFLQGLLDRPDGPHAHSPPLKALLASIVNKFPAENDRNIVDLMTSLLERATNEGPLEEENRLSLVEMVAVVTGAIVRRAKGGKMSPLLQRLTLTPATPLIGHHFARKLEQVVAPILDKDGGLSITIPTWKAKTYHQLVRPMLEKALPRPDCSNEELLVCSNYRVAVLGMLRWVGFNVYEDDVDMVLRAAICLAQDLPHRREAASALGAIKTVLTENPKSAKSHLETLVRICQQTLEQQQPQHPAWMLADYVDSDVSPRASHTCKMLALDILILMAQKFEKNDSQIQTAATTVNRVLTRASGLSVRLLREKARVARNVWRTVKA